MSKLYTPDFLSVYQIANEDSRSKYDFKIIVDFKYSYIEDLVVKGDSFIGFWDGDKWTMDMNELIVLIDKHIHSSFNSIKSKYPDAKIDYGYMNSERSGIMQVFMNYCKKQTSSTVQFNKNILFNDRVPVREDYSTYQLPYHPMSGKTPAFDEMMSVLYAPEQLDKILWSLGALFTGDISKIEKFLFLYGPKGTGKGTVLNIIKMMTGDYCATIDLKQLTGSSEFATADVQELPIFMDADSDLSKITNEQNLLKLTSHEDLLVRKLYKQGYPVRFMGLLVTASNERFRMKNVDSGITRRALVVEPSKNTLPMSKYRKLYDKVEYEIPYIAQKCIDRYNELGMSYYQYEMDIDTLEYNDKVFKFVREYSTLLSNEKGINLNMASQLYTSYLEDIGWSTTGAKAKLQTELRRYFKVFEEKHINDDGGTERNWYNGFLWEKAFPENVDHSKDFEEYDEIVFREEEKSIFDVELWNAPAQYANKHGTPSKPWDKVTTTLSDIDPSKLHYVMVPENHIVLDFDIKNDKGEKDLALNIAKASLYPETYAEISKSGGGVHLHYIYDGDPSELAPIIEPGVEVKVYNGNSSLRRKYTKSNNSFIAHISTGLPLKPKENKKMYDDIEDIVITEKWLRTFIENCIAKEHHGATKPEMDFMLDKLEQAKANGVKYDLRDMNMDIMRFAMNSSNQKDICMSIYAKLPLTTIEQPEDLTNMSDIVPDEELFFYDWEVFPNVNIVCFKKYSKDFVGDIYSYKVGSPELKALAEKFHKEMMESIPEEAWNGESMTGPNMEWGVWYNPTPEMIRDLVKLPTVGYNNLGYDNHIMYDVMMGKNPADIFKQSQDIIEGPKSKNPGKRGGAYGISYTDLYELMDIRQSLKQWEIDMGYPHVESEEPWDQPLPKEKWGVTAKYCMTDVGATEFTFRAQPGQDPYIARKIMCEITGLAPCTKTQQLGEAFIFGTDQNPQDKFNWYDLAEEFPGYTFDQYRKPQSLYLGEEPSEGGYVYAEPGVHQNVVVLDIASLHPHSLIAINYFGPYTPKFAAIVKLRMYIKHKEFDKALSAFDEVDKVFGEKLKPYLKDLSKAVGLAHALKIIINMIYGMTSAKWPNKFKDPRNIDNIVAKRGALFMIMLKQEVQAMGYQVVHIKTDSIKIANGDQKIIDYCMKRARDFKYEFEHEHTYSRMALVNDAVLIAQVCYPEKEMNDWEAVGTQFKQPFVKHTLFPTESKQEKVTDKDFFIFKKSQKGPIYLGDQFIGKNAEIYASKTGSIATVLREEEISQRVKAYMEKPLDKILPKYKSEGLPMHEIYENRYQFIADKIKVDKQVIKDIVATNYEPYINYKPVALTGTDGYKWKLSSQYEGYSDIDMDYYFGLVNDAVDNIYSVGDGNIMFAGTQYERNKKK